MSSILDDISHLMEAIFKEWVFFQSQEEVWDKIYTQVRQGQGYLGRNRYSSNH